MSSEDFTIRKALISDVKSIQLLINQNAKKGLMLPRSLSHIYDNIRDFFVCENSRGTVVGCCALHIVWEDLAEIKSLVVKTRYRGNDIGTMLISHVIEDAKRIGVVRVFTLTYVPDFFKKNKFRRLDKKNLPAKVWRECIECPLFPDCGEVALHRKL